MFAKPIRLAMAGTAVALLLSTSTFAAKIPLSDGAIAEITGSANDTLFGEKSGTGVSSSGNSSTLPASDPWANGLTTDHSQNFIATNQSGSDSQVQQNINGLNNALSVGSVSQNAIINSGGTIDGGLNVVGYAVVARSDF